MRRTAVVAMAAVVVALVLAAFGALSGIGDAKPGGVDAFGVSATTASHNVCKKSALDVPACGVLWGLYTTPVPAPGGWVAPYEKLEKPINRRFDIVKRYVDWEPGTTFPSATDRSIAANGKRILDFSWNAVDYGTGATVSYTSIADGSWDASVILPEAQQLKAFHYKVFIDFNHEFDGSDKAAAGTPAQYVAAYRHIHQVMHQAGVRNVIWAWVSTGNPAHEAQIKAGYPGSGYVNWVGYDPYNFGQCHSEAWRSPYQTFHRFYEWLGTQPTMKNKPIMLGEYGSVSGPAVGAWYAEVPQALRQLPRIKAVIQWSSATSSVCDFRLTDSAAALAGFTAASHSPYVTGASR
jgi:Glycosyl hydrolase family 26